MTKCRLSHKSALPNSRGHSSRNNFRKTAKARPYWRVMGFFLEFELRPKFHFWIYCNVRNSILYFSAIYREPIISRCVNRYVLTTYQMMLYKCFYCFVKPVEFCQSLILLKDLQSSRVSNWYIVFLFRDLFFIIQAEGSIALFRHVIHIHWYKSGKGILI